MKKIVIFVCLTLVAQNSPMNAPVYAARLAAVAFATAPVTLPGAYYYFKTERVKKECAQNNSKSDASSNEYRHFVQGAFYGAVPPVNAVFLFIGSLVFLAETYESVNKWAEGRPIITSKSSPSSDDFSAGTGFVAGLSLWATVPAALNKVMTKEAALLKIARRGR